MNKILNKIFTGFFPVSRIKSTLFCFIVLYGGVLFMQLQSDFSMQRAIMVENKQPGGIIMLSGVKHTVPYRTEKTLVKFEIDNATDFLLLSNGEPNESFITSILKLGICVFLLIIIWNFDFLDPFNTRHLKQISILCNLAIGLIFIEYLKYYYTMQWANDTKHGLGDFKFISDFNLFYYIASIWIVRMIISFYQSGVKAKQELEFTI